MSRVNFGAKPLMFPQPVLIIGTYDENGVPNAMNAAWGDNRKRKSTPRRGVRFFFFILKTRA